MEKDDSLRYIELARRVSRMSLDPSTKVGAVLVGEDGAVLGVGCNRFPDRIGQNIEYYEDRPFKVANITHAEEVATDGVEIDELQGATMYTNFPVCPDCIRFLNSRGVKRAVCPPLPVEGKSKEWQDEWKTRVMESSKIAQELNFSLEVRWV